MRKPIFAFFLLLSLVFVTSLSAQSGRLYDTEDGLSSTFVNYLYQDSRGYIWIATEYGLNKYDGIHFTNYLHDANDSSSLRNNYVRCLFEDKAKNLFVGCYNGLMIYDVATDAFKDIPMFRDEQQQAPHVTAIYQLQNGEIWATTAGQGIFKYDASTETAYSLVEVMEVLEFYFLNCIHQDAQGRIWIGTEYMGVVCLDEGKRRIYSYPLLPENAVLTLAETDQNEMLIGMKKEGVARYVENTDRFEPVLEEGGNGHLSVYAFGKIGDRVFVGCDGEGIRSYNPHTKFLDPYTPDFNSRDYSNVRVHALLQDQDKNTWIGISQKGVAYINHREAQFDYMGHRAQINPIGYNCVTAIYKDKFDYLWVSTDNEGLFKLDRQGKRVNHFLPKNKGGDIPSVIYAIFEDSNDNLWIASPSDALGCLDRKTGRWIKRDEMGLSSVVGICEAPDGTLFMGTFGSGLYSYHPETGIKRNFLGSKSDDPAERNKALSNNWINAVKCDSDGLIWIGHYKGISCYDPVNDDFTCFTGQNLLIPGCIGYVIEEDDRGVIWAGTSEGLFSFDKRTKELKNYNSSNGLINNVVCGIGQDDRGDLWLTTYMGLSHFRQATSSFVNYDVKDGLQGNEFFHGAYFKDKNGKLYFGGVNGVTSFYPESMTAESYDFKVEITDFSLSQQPVNINTRSGGKPIIETAVADARNFSLAHNDNTFTISFSTLTYNNTQQIVYSYRIKELNKAWSTTDMGQSRVTYNNLPPGHYTFQVYAIANGEGPSVRTLHITIRPPWYLSAWAKGVYLFLALMAILALVYYLRWRSKLKQRRLERRHQAEMNAAKLQSFINISHEIRTPMTLIMSPLEKLLKTEVATETVRTYRLIYRNAHRILNLVNQLMDIHKLDKGQMTLQYEEVELVSFVDEVVQSFEYAAQKRGIDIRFVHTDERLTAEVDGEHLDKILLNILSNALKYTPEDGLIEITLEAVSAEDEWVQLSIKDNGIGVEQSKLEKIFECFYRVDNPITHTSTGTGIGLYLSRLLVKLHGGTIRAERVAEEGGTCFVVRLPRYAIRNSDDETVCLSAERHRGWTENVVIQEALTEKGSVQRKATRSTIHLLIVEDDKEICDYLHKELSELYKVSVCHNGQEAYDSIMTKLPDIVVSDVMMPKMDGMELCKRIRSNININHLPIVLLTARSKAEDRVEGMQLGADAYLAKPFSMEVLKSTVDGLIQNRHLLKTKYSGAQEQKEKTVALEIKTPNELLMERIMRVINDNLSNPELNVEMLAAEVGLSRVHVHRKMKELTNQSARDFIRNTRLRQAAQLLQEKNLGVSDVAYATGFSTLSYFSSQFKLTYGVSPKEYRESHRFSSSTPINS